MPSDAIARLTAVVDPQLSAVLRDLTPISYSTGASAENDHPGHVRSASGLRRSGGRLVIVQDDVNVLAVRTDDDRTLAVLLPVGANNRRVFDDVVGIKAAKMDLEACVV